MLKLEKFACRFALVAIAFAVIGLGYELPALASPNVVINNPMAVRPSDAAPTPPAQPSPINGACLWTSCPRTPGKPPRIRF